MHDSLTKFVVHLNDFEMVEVEMVDVLFVAGDFYRDPLEKGTIKIPVHSVAGVVAFWQDRGTNDDYFSRILYQSVVQRQLKIRLR